MNESAQAVHDGGEFGTPAEIDWLTRAHDYGVDAAEEYAGTEMGDEIKSLVISIEQYLEGDLILIESMVVNDDWARACNLYE